jgi:hypothetical protein
LSASVAEEVTERALVTTKGPPSQNKKKGIRKLEVLMMKSMGVYLMLRA